jgi:head-tail adaptor
MRTDLGAMNRSAVIQRPTGTSAFETVDTVPGALELMSAATIESLQSGAPTAQTVWRWRLRYRTDLKSEWRIQDAEDGRVFQIHGYGDPDGRKARTVVICTELQ